MGDFKILSYEEERKLSNDDKIKYYTELKRYLSSIKYSLSKKIFLKISENINQKVVRYIIDHIKGYNLYIENQKNIPGGPVIYASTHQDFNDHFNIVLAIPNHAIILNSICVPKLVKLAMNINGIEYVDRNCSQSRFNSKINLMEYLSKGKSIVVFPEGTFNCSPNRLILPIHSGVIDIAKKMQVPIVPVVQEYNFDTSKLDGRNRIKDCTIRFGKPINVSFYDDIHLKREELEESLSTIRFEIFKEKEISSRKSISEEEYISFLLSRLHTMELMGVNYEIEKETIYGANDEFYDYFPINAVFSSAQKELTKRRKENKIKKL